MTKIQYILSKKSQVLVIIDDFCVVLANDLILKNTHLIANAFFSYNVCLPIDGDRISQKQDCT